MKMTSSGLSSGMALKDKLPFSLRTNVSGEIYAAGKWKNTFVQNILYLYQEVILLLFLIKYSTFSTNQ